MRTCLRHTLVCCLATLTFAGGAFALSSSAAVHTGWAPLVRLFGRGDTSTAVKELRRLTAAYTTTLHHLEIDEHTQDFIDGLLEDLEDFDLDAFHERLPEERGNSRELWVRGDLVGKKYLVRRADGKDGKQSYLVSLKGARTELGAMSTTVRSTPGRGHDDRPTYLLSGRYAVGVGAFAWDAATDAISAFVKVLSQGAVAEGEPGAASAETRKLVSKLHPGLAEEDMAILSLLFEAYPELSKTLSRLGRVEDVRTLQAGKPYQKISVKLRGLIDRFEEHYPAFAKHLDRLDDIGRFDIKWLDAKGRTLLTARVDSEKLTVQVDCHVRDGKLVPSKGTEVLADEPLEYLTKEDYDGTRIAIDGRFKLLGVVLKLTNLSVKGWYEPNGTWAAMGANMKSAPTGIHVEGAALGFVPTGMVDAFIPGNIESITRDFFEVAGKGNQGRGVAIDLRFGSLAAGKNGVVEASMAGEALDNFLVKIGLGMVNDRLVPNNRAIEQSKKFAADIHDAFVRDLARYSGKAYDG